MTTEQYDFKANKNNHKYKHFNRLLLGGEVGKFVTCPKYNESDLQIDLKINGHQVVLKDFNEVLTDWANGIERSVEDSRGITDFDEAVNQKAEQLIKEKLNVIEEQYRQLTESIWDSQ